MILVLLFIFFLVLVSVSGAFFFRSMELGNRAKTLANLDTCLLEIQLPSDVRKSPLAMENFLAFLHRPDDDEKFLDIFWDGKFRPWFSLEMVSLGGKVHFYIWTQRAFRKLVESQLYADYPNIIISEVDDYTKKIDLGGDEAIDLWGFEAATLKPDCYPLKTYFDYGMDKDQNMDADQKVDPMTSLVSFLSSIDSHEQVWCQILIRAARPKYNWWSRKSMTWQDEGRAEIEKLMKRDKKPDESSEAILKNLEQSTEGEKELVSAIERNIAKNGFETAIRSMYLYPKSRVDHSRKAGLGSSVMMFNAEGRNGIIPSTGPTKVTYPWNDFMGIRVLRKKSKFLKAYRHRGFFYLPFSDDKKTFVLNTEELATLFHLPGQASHTPEIDRIESRRVSPPPNLPI